MCRRTTGCSWPPRSVYSCCYRHRLATSPPNPARAALPAIDLPQFVAALAGARWAMVTIEPPGAAAAPDARAGHGARGLTTREAAERLRRDGPNRLPQPERRRWLQVVWTV